ncbi:MAG: hypothetical protein KDB87_22060, partial [Flavobacteriales bacterium]|nr:hypothetical protein [Flavobacteriales bacterium]
VLCLYLSLIGDRHSLLTMAIVAGLLLWSMTGKQVVRRGLPLFALLAVALLLGGQLRAFGTQELRTLEPQERIDEGPFVLPEIAHVPRRPEGPVRKAANVLLSNEMFAAHFSMYGILRNSVPPEPFISMRYLWASAAPAFVRGERPSSAYDLYARGAHLQEGQGYTIHHAAGWYLNAGFAGPLLGGLLLGLVWGGVVRLRNRTDKYHPVLGVLPFLFVAFLPQVLRNGPEAYRTLLVEGLLLPVLILLLTSAYRRRGRTPDIP